MDLTAATSRPPISLTVPNKTTVNPRTTTLIVDISVMRQSDIMEWIFQKNFKTLIPANDMTRLRIESKTLAPESSSAHHAEELIRSAVKNQKQVKIVDITQRDITKEALDKAPSSPPRSDEDEDISMIVKIARRATDELKEKARAAKKSPPTSPTSPYTEAETAVLLTENDKARLQASKENVMAYRGRPFKQRFVERA
jgi:hypothetical protein